MNRARRALQLFEQALEISPDQLTSFLDESCLDDIDLRAEVNALLASVEESSNLLPDSPSADQSACSASDSDTDVSGCSLNHSRLQPDFVLADRYTIINTLGVGGMGEVYRANDSRLERHVAIKVLNASILDDVNMQERFEREIKSVAALSHPNIVTLHDISKLDEIQFAVMELVEGKTLRQLIGEGLDWQTTAKLAHGIASGLSSAHSQNLMHRDIKPENVIVSDNEHAKILDFGLARPETPTAKQDLTATASLVPGTVPYMSPEQTESKPLACSTDIFSFGTVLFEMLTGVNPFRASTVFQTMRNISEVALPETVDFLSAVPQEMVSLVKSMLSKQPDQRPTAADVVFQLNALQKLPNDSDSTVISDSKLSQFVTSAPNNLPSRRIEFTGRSEEIAAVSDSLRKNALVTLVGPGGVGKTSLALEAARNVLGEFPGGTWICEFASLHDPAAVSEVITAALDGNAGTISDVDQVVARLQEQPTMLLFDNCEHLIDVVAELAESLIERVAGLTILATSRESLGIVGERIINLEGLPFLGADSEAMELFIQRASSVSSFQLAPQRHQLIEQIVTRLEGLPLAIELAVPQLASMSLEELLEALDDQMETLRTSRRSQDRQATVSQTITWSFNLLSAEEQQLLLSLSVFAGKFTSEAASQIGEVESGIRRKLQRLVEQSMLVRTEHNGQSRFRLLEPIRQYCQAKVEAEALSRARHRHAYHFASRAAELGKGIYGVREIECAEALNFEWPDLRKAIAWGRELAVIEVAVDPIVALTRTIMFQLRVEAFQWMSAAVEQFGSAVTQRADVNYVIGTGMWIKGDHQQAQSYLDRCDQLGSYAPNYYMQFSQLFHLQRFLDGLEVIQQGRETAKTEGDELESRWLSMPFAANTIGMTDPHDPRVDMSMESNGREILELDWPTGHAYVLMVQGTIALNRGDLPAAGQYMRQSIEKANSCGNRALATLVGLFVDGLKDATTSPPERLQSVIKNLQIMIDTGV